MNQEEECEYSERRLSGDSGGAIFAAAATAGAAGSTRGDGGGSCGGTSGDTSPRDPDGPK